MRGPIIPSAQKGGKGMPLNLSDNEITMGLAVGLLLGEDAILE